MKLFVVHRSACGYAREDQPISDVVGAYTDITVAKKVALLSRGTWTEVDVDYIWPGIEQAAPEFGIKLY